MEKIDILGVKIDNFSKFEALGVVERFLSDGGQHYIVTPNPEMVVLAQKDTEFKKILNEADLAIPDGSGLIFASRILAREESKVLNKLEQEKCYSSSELPRLAGASREALKERIHGVDFMVDLLILAETIDKSVYFLGGAPQVAKKLALQINPPTFPQSIQSGRNDGVCVSCPSSPWRYHGVFGKGGGVKEKFPNLKIVGADDGGKINANGAGDRDEETIKLINEANPDILFVAFGHGSNADWISGQGKQEKWIKMNLKKMPSVKIAMGVGGAFDFLSGKVIRAPKILRELNLEWLWRLVSEPRRFKRIFNAVIVFPYLVLQFRIKRLRKSENCESAKTPTPPLPLSEGEGREGEKIS